MSIEERPVAGDTLMVLMQARLAVTMDYTSYLRRVDLLETLSPTSRFPVRILNSEATAGWYSQYWGILPYSFSTVPLERIHIGLVRETN